MRLLPISETFIRKQAESLRRFTPYYAGRRRVPGLGVPHHCSWTVNDGGLYGLMKEIRFLYLGAGKSTLLKLAQQQPSLVHAHFGVDGSRAITLASSLGVPLISTFHGYDATLRDTGLKKFRDGRFYLDNRRRLQQTGAHFIAVSEFIRKKLENQGFPPERTSVEYIGVDLNEFFFTPKNQATSRVLFVGRLVEKKGCALLIQALQRVQEEIRDVELVVIGDGPKRAALQQQAVRCLRNYQFLGAQPSHVVREYMQASDVFCVPSIQGEDGDSEGLGIVFVEAQASGLPVVSFANGGIPEAVVHGKTGFLSPNGDWRQLATDIATMLQNRTLQHLLSVAARQHVERNFDLAKQTSKLEDLYCRVVDQSRP